MEWTCATTSEKREGNGKRGLFMVEHALAKSNEIRRLVVNIETSRNGFDFYFVKISEARLFVSSLTKIAPMRVITTKKLVSTDEQNNSANIKNTTTCEMVPLATEDLVILSKFAKDGAAGNLKGRLALVTKLNSSIHFVSAAPSRDAKIVDICTDMTQDRFWQNEKHYRVFLAATNLVKFIIIDIDLCHSSEKRSSAETSTIKNSSHFALADVEVARESDFGINDLTYRCVTHFGNVLQVGDYCLGYDLASCTYHDDIGTNKDPLVVNFVLPDVILVKKCKGGGVGQDGGDTKTTHTKVVDREPDDEEDGKKKSKRGKERLI